jgi:single-strand DNA-binding protein
MAGLNKVILIGNLTADPEFKTTPSGVPVTTFSIAVGRRFAKESDEVKADFFNVIAWRGLAEFVSKYFTKGKSIVVVGSIQNRSYTTQDGQKRYITEIIADECSFAGNAGNGQNEAQSNSQGMSANIHTSQPQQASVQTANFEEISQDDDLPF